MLKQSLQQKLLQKLSPLQIQVIKLLEIPTAQLEQRIKAEIEENPVLEIAEKKSTRRVGKVMSLVSAKKYLWTTTYRMKIFRLTNYKPTTIQKTTNRMRYPSPKAPHSTSI